MAGGLRLGKALSTVGARGRSPFPAHLQVRYTRLRLSEGERDLPIRLLTCPSVGLPYGDRLLNQQSSCRLALGSALNAGLRRGEVLSRRQR